MLRLVLILQPLYRNYDHGNISLSHTSCFNVINYEKTIYEAA